MSERRVLKERRVLILNKMGVRLHVAVARLGVASYRYIVSPGRVPVPMQSIVHREDLAPDERFVAKNLPPNEIPLVKLLGWKTRPRLSLGQGFKNGVHLLVFFVRPHDAPDIGKKRSVP